MPVEPNIHVIPGDVDTAIAIMREAAEWCNSTGQTLWYLEDLTREKLLPGLQPDNFLVFRVGGEPAGAMILQWKDELFWPGIPEGESGFVHKLCVRRKFAGQGLTRLIIGYAAEECLRRGVLWLRLDTDATRAKLLGLYDGLGFARAGRKTVGRFDVMLYEMRLEAAQPPATEEEPA